jgi:uncharacterized protein YjiS (DUF1127 family)
MYETPYRSRTAATLFIAAVALLAASRNVRAAARSLDAWLERRRVAAAALHDFGKMTPRDLLDIGLAPGDVYRVAWGASDRRHPS